MWLDQFSRSPQNRHLPNNRRKNQSATDQFHVSGILASILAATPKADLTGLNTSSDQAHENPAKPLIFLVVPSYCSTTSSVLDPQRPLSVKLGERPNLDQPTS